MATRIDIEITSDRGDGSLTWPSSWAKQPKGVLDATLLPSGMGVGDVVRAEAEFTIDGPEIIALATIEQARGDGIQRLELIGSGPSQGGVTTDLAKKGRRGGGRGDRSRSRGDGPRRGGDDRNRGGTRGPGRAAQIRPGRSHRQAWIASLPEARQPVAEQLMHEGIDGVKGALERQNASAAAEGRDPIDIGPIMRIAYDLMPGLAKAEWQDTADAVLGAIDSADLRELRRQFSAGAEHFDPGFVTTFRSKLNARVDRDQAAWAREVREALSEDRVVRALQRSGRPAKAGLPLPNDLVTQLCDAATAALDPEEESSRWITVVEALANSPVRRLVTPAEVPEQSDEDLLDTVDRLAHLVPGVASAFGIESSRSASPRRSKRS